MKKSTYFLATLGLLIISVGGCSNSPSNGFETASVEVQQTAASTFVGFLESQENNSVIGSIANSENTNIESDEGTSITYKIASSLDNAGSTIKFYFNDTRSGRSLIKAEIDVPRLVRGSKFLSEGKVRDKIQSALKSYVAGVAADNALTASHALGEINMVLLAVDVATNSTSEDQDMALLGDLLSAETDVAAASSESEGKETEVSEHRITGKPSLAFSDDTSYTDDNAYADSSENQYDSGDEW